jgi:ABC-type arginine/histidine transport system permease subunit
LLRGGTRIWAVTIRSTSLLVPFYLLYYGFGQIVLSERIRDAFVAFSVNESAYVTDGIVWCDWCLSAAWRDRGG